MALIKVPQPQPSSLDWRNSELEATDKFMMISDFPYKTEMADYRQQLRDWPDSKSYPDNRPARPTTTDGKEIK